MRIYMLGFTLCLILVGSVVSSVGQSVNPAPSLEPPATGSFPRITAFLDVWKAEGIFWHNLGEEDIRVLEDDQPINLVNINETRPGVQLVVALNPGKSFLIRDAEGNSRYDRVMENLVNWSRIRLGTTIDDLSILVTDGPSRSHISNALELFYTLSTYQVDEAVQPNLDTIFKAVEVASDPTPRPGMNKVVLLITAPMEGDLALSFQNLLTRAKEEHVRFFIWLIANPEIISSQAAFDLIELANQTNGALVTIADMQNFPNLEDSLEPLRNTYIVSYDSQIRSPGEHTLVAEILAGEQPFQSTAQKFMFSLQPPNPMFIDPIVEIKRSTQSQLINAGENDADGFTPLEYPFKILIDFPDGHPRPIITSRLYVDGNVVIERNEPPFDQLTWNLRGLQQSNQHILQVEVIDNLGLAGKSIDTPIQLKVASKNLSTTGFFSRNLPLVAGVIVIFTISVLLLVFIMGGRIQPRSLELARGKQKKQASRNDPLTQPVPARIEQATQTLAQRSRQFPMTQSRAQPPTFAYLTRLTETVNTQLPIPQPITIQELIIGKDPTLANLVLDDPTVEAVHTRLLLQPDGTFRIMDAGTLAGTWVNYTPVSRDGARLEHNDLVHIGRVGFRFTLREPTIRLPRSSNNEVASK